MQRVMLAAGAAEETHEGCGETESPRVLPSL